MPITSIFESFETAQGDSTSLPDWPRRHKLKVISDMQPQK